MSTKQIILQQRVQQLVLQQSNNQIIIQGGPMVANILPFTATATIQGQTQFQLLNSQGQAITFSFLICLFIMGTGQNILSGDYTYVDGIVTLGETAPTMYVGDLLFGAGQV